MADTTANQIRVDDGLADSQCRPSDTPVKLSDLEFDKLRKFIRDQTGISMAASKRHLVYRRLSTRLRELNIGSFREYRNYLQSGNESELEKFCNAVTTNLTSFFREAHHFDYLASTILPEIAARKGSTARRLRIWSAGCSTGEEPYSIAMTLSETLTDLRHRDAKILASDLDSNVLATGLAGIYRHEHVEKLPNARLKRWFLSGGTKTNPVFKVRPELQELITFKQLNLMHNWPMNGLFDVIICRNVIIYFDKPTQRILIDRFANQLQDGGHLILGHSESLLNVSDRFALLGQTIYKKEY